MAMPMDYDGLRGEDESERTDNVTDYKRTCIDFIEDISGSIWNGLIITNCHKMRTKKDEARLLV